MWLEVNVTTIAQDGLNNDLNDDKLFSWVEMLARIKDN